MIIKKIIKTSGVTFNVNLSKLRSQITLRSWPKKVEVISGPCSNIYRQCFCYVMLGRVKIIIALQG